MMSMAPTSSDKVAQQMLWIKHHCRQGIAEEDGG